MKSKFVLASAVCAMAALVQASAVESANTFGVMCISDSGDTDTIIGIPWVDVGSTGDANTIHVTNIVCSTGLTTGDLIYWWDASAAEPGYRAWALKAGGYWEPTTVTIVGADDKPSAVAAESNKSLARGNAIILHRQAPKTGDTPNPIYIYGQYYTGSTAATSPITGPTVVEGGYTAPIYNLVASPATTNVDLNVSGLITGVLNANDTIIIGLKTYSYDASEEKWGYRTRVNGRWGAWSYNVEIPAGHGFWYKSKGGSPTFNW